jgi:hypothetical protein
MIHMLFEDNPNSPISELLRKSSYGKYMHFSCGNWKIVSKCMDILNMEIVIHSWKVLLKR